MDLGNTGVTKLAVLVWLEVGSIDTYTTGAAEVDILVLDDIEIVMECESRSTVGMV